MFPWRDALSLTTWTPYPRDALLLYLLYLDRISRLPPTPAFPAPLVPTPLFPTLSWPRRPAPPGLLPGSPPTPLLNSYTLHRLFAATLLVAARFTSDSHIQQGRAAKVGGVEVRELGRLEVEVLKSLEWNLCYALEDVEAVSAVLLRVAEERGLVERLPEPETVEGEKEEQQQDGEEEERTHRTSMDSSEASNGSCRDKVGSFPSPQLVATPDATPPSTGPPSPGSGSESDEVEDDVALGMDHLDLVGRGLGARASTETVRRRSRLGSFGSERGGEVADVVVC